MIRPCAVSRFCTVVAVAVIVLLLATGSNIREGCAQQTSSSVCTYRHLLLIYPNTDVAYVENGTARTFKGNMSAELKTTIIDAFKNLPNLIRNGSDDIVNSTIQIMEISHPITKIAALGSDFYWLNPMCIEEDLELYAPPGAYDSVHVVWHSGAYSGPKAYFGMGGVFINNDTTTFDSIIGGEAWWWTGLGEAFGEPFLHEWLHGVCRFYSKLGYQMPEGDADGATSHGYSKSSTEGWMPYYRDLMRGHVWEPKVAAFTGITMEAWARAPTIPELTSIYILAGAIATTLVFLKFRFKFALRESRKPRK